MENDIKKRFSNNLQRVTNLMSLYSACNQDSYIDVKRDDVLRAAIVFLHASLEELIRGIFKWKFPADKINKSAFDKITLKGFPKTGKFSLGDLVPYKGKTVDEHLERTSYNNINDIIQFLDDVGLRNRDFNHLFNDITEIMNRRHLIVHRADREKDQNLMLVSYKETVDWSIAVRKFGELLFDKCNA
jgi:hypothetical protein